MLPRDPELLGSGTGTPWFPLIIAAASRRIRILSVSIPHSRDQPRIGGHRISRILRNLAGVRILYGVRKMYL